MNFNFKNLPNMLKKQVTPAAKKDLSYDERIRILYMNRILMMILCTILVSYGVFLDAWLFTAGVILFSVGFWFASLFVISNLKAILERGLVSVVISQFKKK